MRLFSFESSINDKYPYKTGNEVCGVVVDKASGKGKVTLSGSGYRTVVVLTDYDPSKKDRYEYLDIRSKQTCMLHGAARVLFIQRWRAINSPTTTSNLPILSPGGAHIFTKGAMEIVIRLQIDALGRYSPPFDKSVLQSNVTLAQFFAWFKNASGCACPGPSLLKFACKDAMPEAVSTEIKIGEEEQFNAMREDIGIQYEKAKTFMPELKEFVVLVSAPQWR